MFCRIFKTDLRLEWITNGKKYIFVPLFFLICCFAFSHEWGDRAVMYPNYESVTPTVWDLWLFLFGGCDRFDPEQGIAFIFPAQWILLILFVCFLNLHSAADNMQIFGQQLLFRGKSRVSWWLSKCLNVCLSVCVYFLLGFLTTICFSFFCGYGFELAVHSFLVQDLLQVFSLVPNDLPGNFVLCGLLAFTAVGTLCLFQLFLTLFFHPVLSFIASAAVLLLSSYFMHPLLIGNYAMELRSEVFVHNGLSLLLGFGILFAVSLIGLLGGAIYCKRLDFLGKESSL